MIFDFSYKTVVTGEQYIPPSLNISPVFAGGLTLSAPDITGINSTHLSMNGQSLLEQTASKEAVGSSIYYQNSGDYYFTYNSTFRFVSWESNLSTDLLNKSCFLYHKIEDQRENSFGSGENSEILSSNFNDSLESRFPEKFSESGLDSFEFFLNGQKIYSGIDSFFLSDDGFEYNGAATGKIFAIPKRAGANFSTGEHPDRSGFEFIESSVVGYINGLAIDKRTWLEIDDGVNMIQTGYQSQIPEHSVSHSVSIIL